MSDADRRRFLRLVGGATVAGLAGCTGGTGSPPSGGSGRAGTWPANRHDPRNSGAVTAVSGVRDGVALATRFPAEYHAISDPLVLEGRVIFGGVEGIQAVEPASGSEAWSVDAPGLARPVTAAGERVFAVRATSRDFAGELLVLDAASGDVLERATGDTMMTPSAVRDGNVFGATFDGRAFALDAEDLEPVWESSLGGAVALDVALSADRLFAPVIGGIEQSELDVSEPTTMEAPGRLVALRTADGTPDWELETPAAAIAPPAAVGGSVYLGTLGGTVHAVDASEGTREWRFETGGPVLTGAAVADGSVFVASDDGHVYAIDADTGEEEWRFQTRSRARASPVVATDTVYCGSDDRQVAALDAETGSVLWDVRPRTGPHGLAPGDGYVHAATFDGLYTLEPGSKTGGTFGEG